MDNSELRYLREKVLRLEARVEHLENKLGLSRPVPGTEPSLCVPVSKPQSVPRDKPTSVSRESWEQKIGGTWLNRLGVVALLVGLAFFLKYAFDNNWINELGRVIIGYCAGALLLGGGYWYHGRGKLPKFGSGLGGAGIGAWFISTWAAYNFYQIFPRIPAFAVMAAVTVAGVVLALSWNSPAIAGLGLLGGYLTPLLIPGAGGYLIQFTYLLILNLGALAVLVKKNWNGLAFISLGFTVLLNAVALLTLYNKAYLLPFMLFLSAYHLLFSLQGLAANLVHRSPARPPLLGISILSGGFYALFSAILLFDGHRPVLAGVLFVWGLFYLAQMAAVRRWRPEDKNLVFVLLCLALGYITLAVPIWLSQTWVTMAWTIQAAVLIAVGRQARSTRVRGWGLLVLGLAIWRLLLIDLGLLTWVGVLVTDSYRAPWTGRLPAFLLVVASMLAAAWLFHSERGSKFERNLVPALVVGANILGLLFLLGEWNRWFYWLGQINPGYSWRAGRATAWTLTMAGNLGLLLALWRRWQYKPVRILTLVLLPIAMLWSGFADTKILFKAAYTGANYISPWAGRLPAALLVAFLALIAAWQFGPGGKGKQYLSWLNAWANILILSVILTELSRYYYGFRDLYPQPWQVYRNTAWSGAMSIHGFILVALGIWRKKALFRRLGIGLLLITVAKITLVDLTGLETIWRILVFIGTGLVLILASWLYQRFLRTTSASS